MRIAVTCHHRMLVGGTESYLNGILPELEKAGHETVLFHEAPVSSGAPVIAAARHSSEWSDLASFRPNLIFNQGLVSPERELSLASLAPVVHFAHNYHGSCISGEKTRKLPHPAACSRHFDARCLAQYLPRNCGGWNPLVMFHDYGIQSARRRAMARAHVVVAASVHMKQEYERNGMKNIRLAPLFVSQNQLPLREPELGSFRILFAGRMTQIKGAAILAEAAPSIRNQIGIPLTLTFAGEGPDRARVREICPEAHFPGWIPQQQLRQLAADHHVLAMPSIWPEPFGLAGLELGLPVAAFAVGGIPDWLTEGRNGALAEPPTAEAFAAAVVRCSHIPNARLNANLAAANFTVAKHMQILLPILESVCAS